MTRVTFYFDLGSPYAYLTAERVDGLLGEPVDWQPILLGGLFGLTGRSSWALGDPARRSSGIAEIERRARAYGLAPVSWPEPLARLTTSPRCAPPPTRSRSGGERAFALAAFRAAFQQGSDLSSVENVLSAGERAGLPSGELRAAMQQPEVKQALRDATDRAHALGVIGVPTIAVDGELFWGDDRLQDAAERLAA